MSGDTSASHKLEKVGLPALAFMFTIDQIASMLNVSEDTVRLVYLYYQGRTSGLKKKHHMMAINIAPDGENASWRVSLEEYRRWLSRMGFRQADLTRM